MADKKFSELPTLDHTTTAAGDFFPLVDLSASTGKTLTLTELEQAVYTDLGIQNAALHLAGDFLAVTLANQPNGWPQLDTNANWPAQILILDDTQANLVAGGALEEDRIAFANDSKQLYVGDAIGTPGTAAAANPLADLTHPQAVGGCQGAINARDPSQFVLRPVAYLVGGSVSKQFLTRVGSGSDTASEFNFATHSKFSVRIKVLFNELDNDSLSAAQVNIIGKANTGSSKGIFEVRLAGTGNVVQLEFGLYSAGTTVKTAKSIAGPGSLLTGDAASGQKVLLMTGTNKFAVSDSVTISDSAHNETGSVASIQEGVSITLSGNLTNAYTVAAGAEVGKPFKCGRFYDIALAYNGAATLATGTATSVTNAVTSLAPMFTAGMAGTAEIHVVGSSTTFPITAVGSSTTCTVTGSPGFSTSAVAVSDDRTKCSMYVDGVPLNIVSTSGNTVPPLLTNVTTSTDNVLSIGNLFTQFLASLQASEAIIWDNLFLNATDAANLFNSGAGIVSGGVLSALSQLPAGGNVIGGVTGQNLQVPTMCWPLTERAGRRLDISATNTATVTGSASNSGLIQLTVASNKSYQLGDTIVVSGVLGTVEANGTWIIQSLNSTTGITLKGSTFTNAWSAGGTQTITGGWHLEPSSSDGTPIKHKDRVIQINDPAGVLQPFLAADIVGNTSTLQGSPQRDTVREPILDPNAGGPDCPGVVFNANNFMVSQSPNWMNVSTGSLFAAVSWSTLPANNGEVFDITSFDARTDTNEKVFMPGMLYPTSTSKLCQHEMRLNDPLNLLSVAAAVTNSTGNTGSEALTAGNSYYSAGDLITREVSSIDGSLGSGSTPGPWRMYINGSEQVLWCADAAHTNSLAPRGLLGWGQLVTNRGWVGLFCYGNGTQAGLNQTVPVGGKGILHEMAAYAPAPTDQQRLLLRRRFDQAWRRDRGRLGNLPQLITVAAATSAVPITSSFVVVVSTISTTTPTLPTAAGNAGVSITVKNGGSGTATVTAASGDAGIVPAGSTISSIASTSTIATGVQGQFISDGTNWWRIV